MSRECALGCRYQAMVIRKTQILHAVIFLDSRRKKKAKTFLLIASKGEEEANKSVTEACVTLSRKKVKKCFFPVLLGQTKLWRVLFHVTNVQFDSNKPHNMAQLSFSHNQSQTQCLF
jgi:hypothetical protein